MKSIILAVIALAFMVSSASAQTSTLDFFGGILYGPEAWLDDEEPGYFPYDSRPDLETQSWLEMDSEILDELNSHGPFFGVGAVAYEFDWNLPDWDTVYDWTLDADLWAEGSYEEGDFEESFSESGIELGTFSLSGLLGASEEDVLTYLSGIPLSEGDDDIGGYLINGDLESGEVYLALYDSIPAILENEEIELPWDISWPEFLNAEFGGSLALTARTTDAVPEPISLSLLSGGLLGLIGLKKKRIL